MTYPKQFIKYIEAVLDYCLSKTRHDEYEVTLKFMPQGHSSDTEEQDVRCEISINSTYLWLIIYVYPGCVVEWKEGRYNSLAHSLLHEISHLFFDPLLELFMDNLAPAMKREATNTLERQNQRVTNALFSSFPKNWYLPSRLLKVQQ